MCVCVGIARQGLHINHNHNHTVIYNFFFFRGWLELQSMIVKLADFFCLSMLKTERFYVTSTREAGPCYVRNVRRTSVPMDVRSLSTPGDAG